jgi:ABC-type transporter Mla maintaining outer membrane lipid asymmetry permease subunit MlaE
MGLAEFATIPLKAFFIGFVVALIACTTGLSVTRSRSDLQAALSRGVTKSVLAALLISGLLTLLL